MTMTVSADEERRRWRRLASELRLQVQLMDPASTGATLTAIGTHLNPEGIFIRLADPPEIGAKVRITLAAEGTGGVLTAEGIVVSRAVLSEDSEARRPPGIGVSLEKTGRAWQKLYQWLNHTAEP